MGEVRGETEEAPPFSGFSLLVRREGRASPGQALRELPRAPPAQDYAGSRGGVEESGEDSLCLTRSSQRGPSQLRPPSLPAQRSLLPPRTPEALSRPERNRKARRGPGLDLSPVRAGR